MKSQSNPGPIRVDELEALLWGCLDVLVPTLPPEQANIIRAIDLEAALPQWVADILGLSLNGVTRHLALGRQSLKDRFGEMHMICPQHGLAGCDYHLNGEAKT